MLPPTFELYLAATLLMCVTPGPNVLLMISLGLRQGVAAVLRGMLGIVAASLLFLAVSAFGVVAALMASPRLFTAIRYAGAAYLIYVGVRMLIAAARPPALATLARGDSHGIAAPRGAAWQGFVTHLSNPKAVIFWSAILPPFVAMDRAVPPQIALLGIIGIAIDAAVLTGYGVFAAAARRSVADPRAHRWLDGIAGAFFVVVGAWLVAAQR